LSRPGSEYWLGSEILADDGFINEQIPIDRPVPIQTSFGDGSVKETQTRTFLSPFFASTVYMRTHVLFYMPLIYVYFLFKRLCGLPTVSYLYRALARTTPIKRVTVECKGPLEDIVELSAPEQSLTSTGN